MKTSSYDDVLRYCPKCGAAGLRSVGRKLVRCSHCGSWIQGSPLRREWYRSPKGKLGGVCSGLAEEFNVSVTLIRLLFVLAAISWGAGILLYIALWIVMPKRPGTKPAGTV